MDWLIWVIVIVLVVGVAWWLLSRRGSASAPAGTSSPADTAPPASAGSPRMDTAAGLAGTAAPAPVPVPPVAEPAAPVPTPAPEPAAAEPGGGDVDDWEDAAVGGTAPAAGATSAEPVAEAVVEPVDEPALADPETAEPVEN